MSCTVFGLTPSTSYALELVAFRGTLNVNAAFGGLSNVTAGATTAPAPKAPGTVNDLAVSAVTDTSITLSFTEVSGGAGLPASYDVRYATKPLTWWLASAANRGTCATPIAGTTVGTRR